MFVNITFHLANRCDQALRDWGRETRFAGGNSGRNQETRTRGVVGGL